MAEYTGFWTGTVLNKTPVTEGRGILVTQYSKGSDKLIIDINNNFIPGCKKNGYGV